MPTIEQPARKSYFFGKGYRDLWATIKEGWELNLESLNTWTSRGTKHFNDGGWSWLLAILCWCAGISVLIFGSIGFALASVFHLTVLGLLFLAVYTIFTAFYLLERLVMLVYRIFVACPHCHHKFDIPVYICPNCSIRHSRLVPGSYGIFKRTCQCGHKLNTSLLTGRAKYEACCPYEHCSRLIENAVSTPFCIPVIGTPNAGKTCFIFSAADSVASHVAPALRWTVTPADAQTAASLAHLRSETAAGRYPLKTASHHAQAYTLKIESGSRIPQLLHLYDSAGEVFTGGNSLDTHHFYGYSHGFVVIVDALAVLNSHSGRFNPAHDTEDAFSRMLNKFQKNHDVKSGTRVNRPMAIVLNKIDSPPLCAEFGDSIHTPASITSKQCEKFMEKNGGHNFIELARGSFQNVRFFAASALTEEGYGLKSKGVDEVMRWLIDETGLGKPVRHRFYAVIPSLLCFMIAGAILGFIVLPKIKDAFFQEQSELALSPSQSFTPRPFEEQPPAPPKLNTASGLPVPEPAPMPKVEQAAIILEPSPAPSAIPVPDNHPSEEFLFGGTFSKMIRPARFEEKFGNAVAEAIWPANYFPADITDVANGGRASRAGLYSEDQIEEIDGYVTRELDEQQLKLVVSKALTKRSFAVGFYRWGERNYVMHRLQRRYRRNQMKGHAWGVGMAITHNVEECSYPLVKEVIADSPAEHSGIKKGDVIISVNGQNCHLSLKRTAEILNAHTCKDEAENQESQALYSLIDKLSGSYASEVTLVICPYRVVDILK